MKAGWEFKKINEVCEIKPSKKEAKELLSDTDLVSFVPMKTLGINQKYFIANETKELSEVSGSYTYFKNNDVLLAKITPCFENGKLGIASGLCNSIGFGSSEFVVYRPSDIVIPEYLYYFLNQQSFRDTGKTLMTGAVGHKRIPKDFYEEFSVPIPPLKEQKQIVAILDDAFAAIEQAQANIEKNIDNAKELFQSKLNDIFSQKGDDWTEKTLDEIAIDFGRGKSKHRPRNDKKLFGGKYPFVQTGDIRNTSKILKNYSQTYNEIGLAQSKLWPKGTICITIAANIAESAILDFESCFPDSIIGLVVDKGKATNDYTYYALQFLKSKLKDLGKGSAQDNINLGTFQKQYFPFPNIEKQREIANILEDIEKIGIKLEHKYQQKLTNLEDLKKSLLEQAFAGELTNKDMPA